MHGKVKLTKREIKEDKFATFVLTAKDRVLESWQYAAIGVAVLVLVVAAIVFFISNQKSSQADATKKLADAQMQYRSGNTQVAIMSLNQLVDEGKGETAENALFLLGRINYETHNYAEATRYWEQYASKYSGNKLNYAAALAGIGACHEDQGQFAEAAAKYNEALQAYPEGPAAGDYMMGALRCYLASGDLQKAHASLAEIKTKYAGTDLSARAIRLVSEKDPTASDS